MSEATVHSQVRFSELNYTNPPGPLVNLDDIKAYFGITDTVLDVPLGMAGDIVSAVIRGYTGRTLSLSDYVETFTDVFEPKIERYLIETPVSAYDTTNVGALMNRQTGRIRLTGGPTMSIRYTGGYANLPADLMAVFMELVRQQMAFMGYETVGTARPADAPKEKAVWVGSLKVEYAVNATTVGAQANGMGAISDQALAPYAGILDQYKSYRKMVAT